MKKQFILPLLALACLAACSSDDEVTTENQEPRLLTVEVSENPMAPENGVRKQAPTRGTEITGETLSAFSMNYQENKYDFSKEGTTWTENTWPTSVEKSTQIDFYAYNDGTFYNSDSPYINYKVDDSSSKDLLVATHKQIAFNDANGKVTLAFDHACAAVEFKAKAASGSVTLTSVTLSGVKNQGSYYYNNEAGSRWSKLDGSATYTLTDADMLLTTEFQSLSCGTLFLIPQNKSGLTLTVKYTDGESAKEWTHNWNSGSWAEGTSYIVEINM
ncbi:MAG: fimbrillin family protein [Bacteroidaceae bacterium]|nr:fimbrillin family protein [Bacteroidaceae bacterium]